MARDSDTSGEIQRVFVAGSEASDLELFFSAHTPEGVTIDISSKKATSTTKEKIELIVTVGALVVDIAKEVRPFIEKLLDYLSDRQERDRQISHVILMGKNPEIADQLADVARDNNLVSLRRLDGKS